MLIYADPPWRFEPRSRETGMDRAADNHYPTMPIDEIKALKVPAARDCVLFLCATVPMMDVAIDVMRAWGFVYKSLYLWIKDRVGTGYWSQNQLELLLVGTKGNMPAPVMGDQPPQVIFDDEDADGEAGVPPIVVFAKRGIHSEKPDVWAKMIEELFPNVPKLLDMFARKRRGGRWVEWGNEVGAKAAQ